MLCTNLVKNYFLTYFPVSLKSFMNSVAHLTHSMIFSIPVINVVSMISMSQDQDSFEITFFTALPVDENIILHTTW